MKFTESYPIGLVEELINMYEKPDNSNKAWKDAIIESAKEWLKFKRKN